MKKIVLSAVAAVALAVFAEEVALGWVFTGYFENMSAAAAETTVPSVSATLQASSEAELDIDSGLPGFQIIVR